MADGFTSGPASGGAAWRRGALLALLALGVAGAPAQAARHDGGAGRGDGWRSVRLCQTESCWAKHPDGWGAASHGRRRR